MHSHMYTRGRGLPPSLADFWNFGLTPDHTSSLGDKIRSIHGVQGGPSRMHFARCGGDGVRTNLAVKRGRMKESITRLE